MSKKLLTALVEGVVGYNGSNQTLYTAQWGTDVILVAIKESLYKDIPVTMYRYRTVSSTPVEYN
jgi:hypothetical protein